MMNYGFAAIGDVFPIERYFYPSFLVMALWIGFGLEYVVAKYLPDKLRHPEKFLP